MRQGEAKGEGLDEEKEEGGKEEGEDVLDSKMKEETKDLKMNVVRNVCSDTGPTKGRNRKETWT